MAIIKNPLTAYHTIPPPKPIRKVIQWSLDARRATIFFRRIKNIGENPDIKIFGTCVHLQTK